MRMRIFGVEITFRFWFFAVMAAILLAGREVLAFYFLLPIVIHECGHLLAMAICGVRVEAITCTAFSIDIRRGVSNRLDYRRDIAISLAGIAANLVAAAALYLFAFQSLRVMLLVAVNLAVAIFNAMPVGTLDGGQALRLILERFGSAEKAYTVSRICSFLLLVPLFGGAIFLLWRGVANLSLLLVCLYLAGTVIFASS
jgi:stage IV sporulation protein FB